MPSITIGRVAASANMRVCGKLKPSGSFQGPNTSQDTKSWATYTSISDTRISLALKRVRSSAGIAAHAAPPAAPARTMAGSTSALSESPK